MTYMLLNPPDRPENYSPAELPHDVLEAIASARITGIPHQYVVKGLWTYGDRRFLDIAVDYAWVVDNTNHQFVNGRLRWVCPGCGKLSGEHAKGCGYR